MRPNILMIPLIRNSYESQQNFISLKETDLTYKNALQKTKQKEPLKRIYSSILREE